VLCCVSATTARANDETIVVQLWTVSVGDELASSWGHAFLRIKTADPVSDRAYDFGRYELTSTFVLDFVLGQLPYHLASSGTRPTYEWLQRRERTIHSRTLEMPDAMAFELSARLRELEKPENRAFPYDPAFNNCATKVRDLLDEIVFDGAWSAAA
jgi:hypothetical protein